MWWLIGVLILIGYGWVKWHNRDGAISVQDWAEEIADDARGYARTTARRAYEAQRDYWQHDDAGEG